LLLWIQLQKAEPSSAPLGGYAWHYTNWDVRLAKHLRCWPRLSWCRKPIFI